VPGQWAVQTALGGFQSIRQLTEPGGRLYESRQAVVEGVERSPYLSVCAPQGALYAFLRVNPDSLPGFDDREFAMQLLDNNHVLIAPGSSFNVRYKDHFRITMLPDAMQLAIVFERMADALETLAAA